MAAAETVWPQVLVGLVVLTLGRRLFWFFVAMVGFVYGMDLAPVVFPAASPAAIWLMAIVTGLIGAVLVYFLEWVAVAAAGFLAGGRIGVLIVAALTTPSATAMAVSFLIGGVIGAALVVRIFDWALILLSSSIGAVLVAGALQVDRGMMLLAVAVLSAAGIIVQAAQLRRG